MKNSSDRIKSYEKYFNTEPLKYGLKKKAAVGAGLTISSRVLDYIISVGGTIILARLLTPDDFGLVTMVMTVSLLLRNFGVNGFPEAIIQEETINHKQLSTLFWIHLGISVALAIVFVISAPAIIWFYNEPRLEPIIYVMSISIIFPCFSTQHTGLLKRTMQFTKFTVNEVVSTLVSTVAGVIMALYGFGYWAIVVRRMAIPASSVVGAWILCRWRPGLPSKKANVMKMVKFAFHTYGNFITYYFSKNIDTILIGKFFGSAPLANYDRAYHLFVMPVNQVTSPLSSVALPILSRLRDDKERFVRYYLKSLSLISFVGMAISAIITLIGKDLVLLLLGPKWDIAALIFTLFGPGIGMMLVYDTHGWLHLSLGTADRWFRWGILSVIITICCIVIGLKFGATGVAAGMSVSFYILVFPGLWYGGRPMNIKLSDIIGSVWKYFISAVAAGGLCWYLLYFFNLVSEIYLSLNILIRMTVSSIFFIILYLLAVVVLYQSLEPISQLLSIIKDMVPKFAKNKQERS